MDWLELIQLTHDEVDRERAARGLPAWKWSKPKMSNRPILQWCANCWLDGEHAVAETNVGGVPLCKICERIVGRDQQMLADLKERWDAAPDGFEKKVSAQADHALKEKASMSERDVLAGEMENTKAGRVPKFVCATEGCTNRRDGPRLRSGPST